MILFRDIFYKIKPFIPRRAQLWLRRGIVQFQRKKYRDNWPIDERAGSPPEGWNGWPENKRFALILTHDVETARGMEKCRDLAILEERFGVRSSFNFVPERYKVSSELRKWLTDRGFEVGVHGLNHDGKYFTSRNVFMERAEKINLYLREWNAVGYRSPSMLRNLEWFGALNIEYDSSTFDTDPFEPQPDGMGTIFPFIVKASFNGKMYVELPYTLPQDSTLFILMRETGIDIWKKKLDWVVEKGGMALVNVHPDYMNFGNRISGIEEYPSKFYEDFLRYVCSKHGTIYWNPLPKELARMLISVNKYTGTYKINDAPQLPT